ncbi:YggN family protein [Vibrio ostreicida]|uniref:YggN family protein n=1 Tax=Vibrio ostreicida TaxID=526588 RepID=A0ABT8BQX0_9VIBR|nr:YggN family protein [Vibrio ostreicida]MDN3609222.1 YggN family protein [Vibrio ostreicida]NPD08114.1 YggN family protein [Vibrio ostreicida]
MKKILFIIPLLIVSQAFASQCDIDLKNHIRLNGEMLEIQKSDGAIALVDADNKLMIQGETILLNADQQQAMVDYHNSLNDYLPRAKQIAQDGLHLINDIIDEVALSFDAPGAFDNVKASIEQFYAGIEERYYQNGDLVLPAGSFASFEQKWAQDFSQAKAALSNELIGSAFNVMSEKMKAQGSLNLTDMADTLSSVKERIERKLTEHSAQVEKQSDELCESLDAMADQEQQLHRKIPELKNYPIFSI